MTHTHRKTKIVCTLGPATDGEGILRGMLEAGMNVASPTEQGKTAIISQQSQANAVKAAILSQRMHTSRNHSREISSPSSQRGHITSPWLQITTKHLAHLWCLSKTANLSSK